MKSRLAQWRAEGCPPPPPDSIKHAAIRSFAHLHGTRILVETGTFYGDTIFALRNDFAEIHSVELAAGLHHFVKNELAHLAHIHLYLGDSAEVLPQITKNLTAPALFWLDGHFCSGPSARAAEDTPVGAELQHLLARSPKADVVLIDDARLFVGHDGYPTLDELKAYISVHRPAARFAVEDDIIRVSPI